MTQKKIQQRAVEALLCAESVSAAAVQCGVSRKTLYRWLADSDFRKALQSARNQAHGLALTRLCALSNKAVNVLSNALDGGNVSKTEFLAARSVLELAGNAVAGDVEARLEEIEQTFREMKRQGVRI